MATDLPEIRYQIPPGETENPFDVFSDKKFFINASGYTYSTNDITLFKDIDNNPMIKKNICNIYKSIIVYEKLSIVEKGKVIKAFSPIHTDIISELFLNPINKYVVISTIPLERKSERCRNLLSPCDSDSFRDNMWATFEDALDASITFSSEDNKRIFFINRVLAWVNWH